MNTRAGYGLKVRKHEEPWGFLFWTYDAAERRKFMDRDYRPEQLEVVRMTWTWEPVEPNAHALAEERSDDSQQRVVGLSGGDKCSRK